MQRAGSVELGSEDLEALRECMKQGSVTYAEAHAFLERSVGEIKFIGRQENVEVLAPPGGIRMPTPTDCSRRRPR
eukprot:4386082-Lingulodinium_polyedra.AAC.1